MLQERRNCHIYIYMFEYHVCMGRYDIMLYMMQHYEHICQIPDDTETAVSVSCLAQALESRSRVPRELRLEIVEHISGRPV